jgi:large subunit ribosomal protein L3
MGTARVTAQNLEVVLVDAERNLVGVRGSVPGAKQGLVVISKAVKTTVRKAQDIIIER